MLANEIFHYLHSYQDNLRNSPEKNLSFHSFVAGIKCILPKKRVQEFLMAIDVTSAGTPREKLLWAFRFSLLRWFMWVNSLDRIYTVRINSRGSISTLFRMYDVDGNGVIDQDEMTKIVQVSEKLLGLMLKIYVISVTWIERVTRRKIVIIIKISGNCSSILIIFILLIINNNNNNIIKNNNNNNRQYTTCWVLGHPSRKTLLKKEQRTSSTGV